jgi:tetratricopeptide (TPR) repeat protein
LSDILDKSSNDIVLVTQVKRTNRSNGFHDALTELWLIYELALQTTPNLIPYLRFRILSKNSELKDFERALSKWHPSKQQPVGLDLEVFRQKVTVQLFSDPEDEVLALLANKLRATEPIAYVHRWLGLLLSAASREGASGFETAAQFIWTDLQSIENASLTTPPGIYVWSSQDKAPENILEGQVLTGERPQVHHLREGFFAPRPAVYDPIAVQVQEWSNDLASNLDKQLRLPVFWIGGRSGSGKSVTLMHVLALLYEAGVGPVLWLGNKTDLLRLAIPWALKLSAKDRQVIIGIDDPYAPNTQSNDVIWKEALAVLEGIRQSGDATALPLIVCCGPSEQAERMQKDLPEEVNVSLSELPEEGRDDIFQLRGWYAQRTKKAPPNIGNENILLVQLFFQWETGQDLGQFASRFRSRIKENDSQGKLEDLITCMLCVNRLYVGYPATAVGKRLTPDLQDTFRRLREEHHIKQTVSDYGIGLWLAHAHLSNLIYENWYPLHSNRAVRTDHLRRVITECLESGASPSEKMAPLWAISNAMFRSSAQSPLIGRLDQQTLTNLLPSVYNSRMQNSSARLTLAELPVWIQLHALSLGKVLSPDPVDEALSQIKVENLEEKGLRLTCHKLLQYYKSFPVEKQSKIIESIIQLLIQTPQWREWAPVTDDAYRQTKDPRFVKLIINWVTDHPRSKWAERLFSFLFDDKPTDPQVLSAARDLLPRVGGELGWGDTAKKLMEASGQEIPASVLEWAANNCRQRGACFVLGELLGRGRRVARSWAFKWCARWHTERTAYYVLEPLLILLGPNKKLRDWCIRWIAVDHRNVHTGYIVEKMIKTFPFDTEVLSIGLRWLENNDQLHGSWQFVWSALYNANPHEMLPGINRQTNFPPSAFPSIGDQPCQDELALNAKQKLPELMPDNAKAWYYLAIGLGKAKRHDEEIAALIKATELDPQYSEAWLSLGAAYSQIGENEPALTATLKLTELSPDDPEAWYYLSIAHSRDGNHKAQVAALIKATELEPQYAEAWWALRDTYYQLGENELALEAELRLAGLKSEDPMSGYDLAITFGRDKSYEAQVAALTKAIELNPDFADAWRALGAAYNQLGWNESALTAALKLTELRPDDAQAWYYLSIAHSKADQYAEQIAALIKVTELDPQFVKAWQALGAVYNQLGETEQSLAAALKLTELKPDDAQAWYYLAIAHSKVGRYEEQIADLIKATQLDPKYVDAWRALESSYHQLGQNESALTAALKLTELSPDDPEAWKALGAVYNQLGETEQSLAAALKLTELKPDDAQAWYYLAIAHSKVGRYEEQIADLTKATQLNPDFVEAWLSLGAVYNQLGQIEQSLSANLKLTELRPNDPEAWQKLGATYNQLGQTEPALAANLKLTELSPDDPEAWYYLSIAHSKANQYEERIAALIKATVLDPQFVKAWEALAAIYLRQPQYALALEAHTAVVKLKPDDAVARQRLSYMLTIVEALKNPYFEPEELKTDEAMKLYSLGRSHVAAGELDEAVHAFNEAIKASPDVTKANSALLQSLFHEATAAFYGELYDRAIIMLKVMLTMDRNIADVWRLLSSSYRRIDKNEEALDAAMHLSTLSPTDAQAWYILGKRYVKLGQLHNAAQAFNQALQLNENLKAARRELNKLPGKNY